MGSCVLFLAKIMLPCFVSLSIHNYKDETGVYLANGREWFPGEAYNDHKLKQCLTLMHTGIYTHHVSNLRPIIQSLQNFKHRNQSYDIISQSSNEPYIQQLHGKVTNNSILH